MGKTFKDINGNMHELSFEKDNNLIDINRDILTDEITGYFVIVKKSDFESEKHEIDEDTYNAIKEFIKENPFEDF